MPHWQGALEGCALLPASVLQVQAGWVHWLLFSHTRAAISYYLQCRSA